MKITSDSSITSAGGSTSSACAITASNAGAVLESISPPMLTTATPWRCTTEVLIGSAADTAILHLESCRSWRVRCRPSPPGKFAEILLQRPSPRGSVSLGARLGPPWRSGRFNVGSVNRSLAGGRRRSDVGSVGCGFAAAAAGPALAPEPNGVARGMGPQDHRGRIADRDVARGDLLRGNDGVRQLRRGARDRQRRGATGLRARLV